MKIILKISKRQRYKTETRVKIDFTRVFYETYQI